MASYVLKRKTYAQEEQQEEKKKSSGLGKKLLAGAAIAGGTLFAAKKGAFGANTQMKVNDKLGQLGGKISQLGAKRNSGFLSNIGDKAMMSAASDYKSGAIKSNTRSLNQAVNQWNNRSGVQKFTGGDALNNTISNKANLRAEKAVSNRMNTWLGGNK